MILLLLPALLDGACFLAVLVCVQRDCQVFERDKRLLPEAVVPNVVPTNIEEILELVAHARLLVTGSLPRAVLVPLHDDAHEQLEEKHRDQELEEALQHIRGPTNEGVRDDYMWDVVEERRIELYRGRRLEQVHTRLHRIYKGTKEALESWVDRPVGEGAQDGDEEADRQEDEKDVDQVIPDFFESIRNHGEPLLESQVLEEADHDGHHDSHLCHEIMLEQLAQ